MSVVETLPHLVVALDNAALNEEYALSLASVRVLQRLSLPSLCELTFHQPPAAFADGDVFAPGAALRVTVGDGQLLFSGEVTAVHHTYGGACQREVRVRGYDCLHRLRKRQSIRTFAEKTFVELASELVSDLNIDVQADDRGPVWPRIVQWHQSDLELLTEVAARCGQYFTLCDGVLRFVSLVGSDTTTSLELGSTLLTADIDASTEPACREVSVHAWDPWLVEPCAGAATTPRSGRDVPLQLDLQSVGSEAQRFDANLVAQDGEQASCAAQAELDRRVAGEVLLEGVAMGDATLHPGNVVEVAGVGRCLAGRYVLTAVTHSIDREQGYRSTIDTSAPAVAKKKSGSATTLGQVRDADDPMGLGRVKVALPAFNGIETDWLEVLTVGAGAGKGLICTPDVEDKVLVLLSHQDPAQGIVLGGLYGAEPPPDTGVEDGRVRRYTLITPGGQRLSLDDDKDTALLETTDGNTLKMSPGRIRFSDNRGSYVEMARDHVRLHSATTLEIEAPGNRVRIRGASVDFEKA